MLASTFAAAAGLGQPARVALDGVDGVRPGMTVVEVSAAWEMALRPTYGVRPPCVAPERPTGRCVSTSARGDG